MKSKEQNQASGKGDARRKTGKGLAVPAARGKGKPVAAGKVRLYLSSEARSNWSQVLREAAEGLDVAILVGSRAFALKEVELTYAEREYGATKAQVDAKADEVEERGLREIRSGKARRIA
jgi:hypothetical protein